MWVDATERIVSFHEIANSDLLHFDHREAYLSYLSALTEQGTASGKLFASKNLIAATKYADAEADEPDWVVRLLPCSGTILAQGEVSCVKCNRNTGERRRFMRQNHTCGTARNAVKYKRI